MPDFKDPVAAEAAYKALQVQEEATRIAREKAEKELKDRKEAEDKAATALKEANLLAKNDYEGLKKLAEEAKKKAEDESKALGLQRIKEQAQTALLREGLKAGIKKEEYLKLVPEFEVKIENGVVVGVDKIVEGFKKANPDLFGVVEAGSGEGRDKKPPAVGATGDFIKAQVDRVELKRRGRVPYGYPDAPAK